MANNVISFSQMVKKKMEAAVSAGNEGIQDRVPDFSDSGFQMSLPFSDVHELLVLDLECFSGNNYFSEFSQALHVCFLLDMRAAPRLDFIQYNRQAAFQYLNAAGIGYVDMLGRAGLDTYESDSESLQSLWGVFMQVIEGIPVGAPMMVLFDNDGFKNRFFSIFENVLDLQRYSAEGVRNIVEDSCKIRM